MNYEYYSGSLPGGFGAIKTTCTVTLTNSRGSFEIFHVTGDVLLRLLAVVNESLDGSGNIEAGIAADPDAILATTVVTALDAREIWHDASPDAEIETLGTLREFIIADGNDITLTLSAVAAEGSLVFYCLWTPLSPDGNIQCATTSTSTTTSTTTSTSTSTSTTTSTTTSTSTSTSTTTTTTTSTSTSTSTTTSSTTSTSTTTTL